MHRLPVGLYERQEKSDYGAKCLLSGKDCLHLKSIELKRDSGLLIPQFTAGIKPQSVSSNILFGGFLINWGEDYGGFSDE